MRQPFPHDEINKRVAQFAAQRLTNQPVLAATLFRDWMNWQERHYFKDYHSISQIAFHRALETCGYPRITRNGGILFARR